MLAAVIAAPVTYYIMGSWGLTSPFWRVWWPAAPSLFYRAPDTYKPTQGLADSTRPAATTIIGGIFLGMKSTAPSSSSVAIVPCRRRLPTTNAANYGELFQGLYGIGIAAVGMPTLASWPPTPTAPWPTTPAASPR